MSFCFSPAERGVLERNCSGEAVEAYWARACWPDERAWTGRGRRGFS